MIAGWPHLSTPTPRGVDSYDLPSKRIVHTGHTGHTCLSNLAGAGAHPRARTPPQAHKERWGSRCVRCGHPAICAPKLRNLWTHLWIEVCPRCGRCGHDCAAAAVDSPPARATADRCHRPAHAKNSRSSGFASEQTGLAAACRRLLGWRVVAPVAARRLPRVRARATTTAGHAARRAAATRGASASAAPFGPATTAALAAAAAFAHEKLRLSVQRTTQRKATSARTSA